MRFNQSHSYPLNDIGAFYQLIRRPYKRNGTNNITGIVKVHLKTDFVQGSIVNGVRGPILYSSALSSPPDHKIIREPRIKLPKKIKKSVLSHISFYLEDDDRRPVKFNNETTRYTCQLIKMTQIKENTITNRLKFSYRYNINYVIIQI